MRYTNVTKINEIIQIGQRGENLANQIRFPIVDLWRKEYGTKGVFTLQHQREEDDEPYIVAVSVHGKNVCWDVTDLDTQYEGRGVAQLQYIVNDTVAKSITFVTEILPSIGEVTETILQPSQAFVDEVTKAGANAILSADKAKTAQARANASAESAILAAKQAQMYAETAEGYYGDIMSSIDDTRDIAETALEATQNIGNSVSRAETAAQAAQTASTAATNAALRAEESAASIDANLGAQIDAINESLSTKLDAARVEEGYLILSANGEDLFSLSGFGGGSGSGGGGGSESDNSAQMTLRNTSGWTSKDISISDDCIVSGEWSSVENEMPTGAGSLSVVIGSTVKHTRSIDQGRFSLNIAPYLSLGSNNVYIRVTDAYGNIRRILFVVSVVSVSVTSTFDYTLAYSSATDIPFTYIPASSYTKTAYFYVDGTLVGVTENINTSGRQLSFTIPAQSHGVHEIECYLTVALDNGAVIESNHLKYEIICYDNSSTAPIIAIDFDPAQEIKQYSTITIPYRVFDPTSVSGADVTISLNGQVVQTLNVNRTQQIFSYFLNSAGNNSLTIACGNASKTINFTAIESDVLVEATKENLELYLTSLGRSNNEENPGTWKYNSINAQFTDFNFTSDGWQLDKDGITMLHVTGDARVTIPYKPFANDFRATGKTLEFEFATSDVIDYDTPIISCMSGGRGFQISATEAMIVSAQEKITTQYKENEHVRIAFVVEKRSDNRLLQCYINGILSGVLQYPADDDFQQVSPVNISIGSNNCAIDIYNIRIYNNNLTRYQIVDNWIADTQLGSLLEERFFENNIFDSNGKIQISKLPSYLPYMVLQCPVLPAYKGDKKPTDGYYVNPEDHTKDFTFTGASINVQGTSSQYYARKNWKISFKKGFYINGSSEASPKYALRTNSVPVADFTFKADVASSEGANNVELVGIYNDTCPYQTPPQKENPYVRQGIDGFPIVMFWEPAPGDIQFLGKYNFNNDKGTAPTFGFDDNDESWETKDNTLALSQFKTDDVEAYTIKEDASGEQTIIYDWANAFEGRHPDGADMIERDEANNYVYHMPELIRWIASTDSLAATNEELENPVTYSGTTFTNDTADYRLAKFKNEAKNWFVMDDLFFYYVFTELFLMVDSRVKNSFPTFFNEEGKWCFLPYDMDTAIGINNEGSLAFTYSLEDIDKTEAGADVFNGQESVLWNNVRACFGAEIKAMYKQVRSNGLTYDAVEKRFEDHQKKWSASIFNEDAYYKYIEPLINGTTVDENNQITKSDAYLPMCQGSKAEQRKWWLYNRFRYLDSKYETGLAASSYINFRAYSNGDFTITPYADVYARVGVGSLESTVRAKRNEAYTLHVNRTDANDTEVMIYSADQLKDIGDLSVFTPGYCNIAAATRLQRLKIGSDRINRNFGANGHTLTLGNNVLLQYLDVRNCPNLTTTIDASQCKSLQEVYFEGSGITGINLPNGGVLRTLHLPSTITNLTIKNQTKIRDFRIDGNNYSNISTINFENVSPQVPLLTILSSIKEGSRVRLVDLVFNANSTEEVLNFYRKLETMRGIDENGLNVETPQISGVINIGTLYMSTELQGYIDKYSELKINSTHNGFLISFYDSEGKQLLATATSYDGAAVTYPKAAPTKDSSVSEVYTFAGWTNELGTDAQENILNRFTEDTKLYAVFIASTRQYTIKFSDGVNTLQTSAVAYGTVPAYYGETPIYQGSDSKYHDFLYWSPIPYAVDSDQVYTAAFKDITPVTIGLVENTVQEYKSNTLTTIPYDMFASNTALLTVVAPAVTSIGSRAFQDATNLMSIDLTDIAEIGTDAFRRCVNLTDIYLRGDHMCAYYSSNDPTNPHLKIHVPAELLESYKRATNWSRMASKFVAL